MPAALKRYYGSEHLHFITYIAAITGKRGWPRLAGAICSCGF